MAKGLFNGTCIKCHLFKPRCAYVYMRLAGKATEYTRSVGVLCEGCRKDYHGCYRLDERHKAGGKV